MALSLKPRHLSRYADIAQLLIRHARSGSRDKAADDRGSTADDARRLVEELETMGPTFIKLGQLLSTRADLLPQPYLEALERLQDRVEAVPFAEMEDVFTAEVGVKLSKAFTSFDPVPLASASLGQVHRATLRSGRRVAVKLQRPGAKVRVIDDMEVIEELAEFVDAHTNVGRSFGFTGMVEEFRRSILAELDYRLEAANLRLLGANLVTYERIVVPQPVDEYTTERVLTMDLVDGRNLGALSPVVLAEVDGAALCGEIFSAYLDQILLHGFLHADPHPGNVLLTPDHKLALVDLGMVAHLTPALQDALVRLLLALADGNGEGVAEVISTLGEKRDRWDRQRFTREIVRLVHQGHATTVGRLEAGRIVGQLAYAAAESGLRPPVELTMVGKALLNLDHVACRLDPNFDPHAAIQRHVAEIMRRKMLDTASPANVLSAVIDAKEFVEKLPGRVNKVMDALAEGQLTLNVEGIDEQELMRGIQKLANRVTTGVIIAALIVGASMLVRVNTRSKLFGYPTIAIVCFMAAATAGVWLIGTSVLHDLPQRRRRGR